MITVQISDSKNGMLTFDLKEILVALPEFASQLTWFVLEIEGVGLGLNGESMLMTEASVESSAHGIRLLFVELMRFASGLEQAVNATFVGVSNLLPSLPLALPYPPPFIVLEAVDSSRWVVTSSEISVLRALVEHFPETTQTHY